MIACGLDFGTSNSAIGVLRGNAPALAPVEGESTLIPSAVFFEDQDRYRVRFDSTLPPNGNWKALGDYQNISK